MTPRRATRARLAAVMFATLTAVAATTHGAGRRAAVDAAPDVSCNHAGGPHPGTRMPVLLVHGYTGSSGDWLPATMQYLAHAPARTCVTTFDYGPYSTQWVTDAHIGQALAGEILALANASKAAGGIGKVFIVAHSMGGLAVRCAADPDCSDTPPGMVAERIRGLVTLGTPQHGSQLEANHTADDVVHKVLGPIFAAHCVIPGVQDTVYGIGCGTWRAWTTSDASKAFEPGSLLLRKLPQLPARPAFPVLAVAGSVKVTTTVFAYSPVIGPVWKTLALGDAGDMIVSRESALAVSRRADGLGGTQVIDCGQIDLTRLVLVPVCDHLREPNSFLFLEPARAMIDGAEQQDRVRLAQSPIKTVTIRTFENPNGTMTPLLVKYWAIDQLNDCARHAYGAPVIAFLRAHPCFRLTRQLATTVWHGRPVALEQADLVFADPDASVALRVAGKFGDLLLADQTGSVNDLLREGHRFPGGPAAIPVGEVFRVQGEDGGVTIDDAWYLDGPTADTDPGLTRLTDYYKDFAIAAH